MDGVVDSVPPDEGCEVLDEEVNDEECDQNDNKMSLIVITPIFW